MAFVRSGPLLRRTGGAGRAAPGLRRRPMEPLRPPRTRGPGRATGRRRPGDAGHRGDLHRLRGDDRGGPPLAVRHHPPRRSLRRVAPHRIGAGPAVERPQSLHRRRLPRPDGGERRHRPLGVGGRLAELPAGVRRRGPPGRDLGPHLRQRPHPRRRRDGLRAGGQPAGPLGRVLPSREPLGGQTRLPRDVPALQHRARRPLCRATGQYAGLGITLHRRPHHRRADAGHL